MFNKSFIGLICFLLLSPQLASADVRLPKLLSSGMVLQRGAEVKIWGWADPGEKISVTLNDANRSTEADGKGRWQVLLPAMIAGGPYTLHVKGNNTLNLEDVLIGDVWLASGQSNMELTLARAEPRFAQLVPTINNHQIRQFEVPDRFNFKEPQGDVESGHWQTATQDNIRQFSAVAYFFAEQLQKQEQVPIGIINASLGGSPVEAWMSESSLKKFPEPYQEGLRFRNDGLIKKITEADQARSKAWYEKLHKKDEGYDQGQYLWAQPEFKTADWQAVQVPSFWADNEVDDDNGVVWFRKTFNLPKHLAKQEALLVLGAIVDADQVFVNGTLVGETIYMYPPRRYKVPPETLTPGDNTITVRVISQQGRGGFIPGKEYVLQFADETINLAGQWRFKRGATMQALPSQTSIHWKPMGLYNAMIAPLLNFQIKGVIWYQGESNAGNAEAYRERFLAMIADWRQQWQQKNLPFLFVQLANYVSPGEARSQVGNWPDLRQAQLDTLAVPNTAMVVSIDAGEWNDIHPLDKQTIGYRLAAAAQHVAYGKEIVYSGPIISSAKRRGKKVILAFNHIGSGLLARDEPLQGFTVAGENGDFHRAQARIEKDRIVVWSEAVIAPSTVRYAWSNNPELANLFNAEGFPASPFEANVVVK